MPLPGDRGSSLRGSFLQSEPSLSLPSTETEARGVGLEDSLYLSRGVYATNAQLVERAATLARDAGREIATAQEAREMLGLTKKILF